MCLIAFALGVSHRWPLVVASNRDEFLSRPTLPLKKWKTISGQCVISGRDSQAGGTWLGISPAGRVAFLTNVREARSSAARLSRGELAIRWLADKESVTHFAAALEKDKARYGGYNLVVGDLQNNLWAWLSNRSNSSAAHWNAKILKPGLYGLSNAALDTPWPKTTALKTVLAGVLQHGNTVSSLEALHKPLWEALARREKMAFASLPTPGISKAMQTALSSTFVDFPELGYGTRSSTLVVASRSQQHPAKTSSLHIDVNERTHLPTGFRGALPLFQEVNLSFDLL